MWRKGFGVAMVVVVVVLAVGVFAWATAVNTTRIFETFDDVIVKAENDIDSDPYWWIIQNGDLGQYYASCGDASCTDALSEKGTTFARLRLWPDTTPGNLTVSEISELRTGYSYGQGRWLPTPDRPVVATARVRFSPNYLADGSGGARGSTGFWLYNSYLDFPNQTLHPITALGFGWGEQGTSGGELEGLRVMVLQDSVPVYNEAVQPAVDMSAWMTWKMIWSIASDGKQEVGFWVDGQPLGHVVLPEPLPALSITFWDDNQFAVILNGSLSVEYHTPSADQYFDIDSVEVSR